MHIVVKVGAYDVLLAGLAPASRTNMILWRGGWRGVISMHKNHESTTHELLLLLLLLLFYFY